MPPMGSSMALSSSAAAEGPDGCFTRRRRDATMLRAPLASPGGQGWALGGGRRAVESCQGGIRGT
jgi:hypothetical protein